MNDEPPLTREQFTAARMLIARLRSEAAHEPFEFDDIGVQWLITDDVLCAAADNGDLLRIGDLFYACIVMLWSMVLAHADEAQCHPLDVVSNLGLGLAQHDPT